jgi:thiamine-phosphate pyrophosphorylase
MSLAAPDAAGPLRRERLRTARLYFVCDARPRGEDPEPLLRAALTGGVDIVQLREKELGRRAIEIAGATFRRLCDTYSALFIVNDDPALARSCRADGVHVGQDDAAVEDARSLLGSEALIGLSTHSREQIDS